MKKKILSILLAVVMLFTCLPISTSATEDENVYISLSYDGQYVTDANGNYMAYVPVPMRALESIDLADYNLDYYNYDGDGDGTNDVTALHLYIYTHENLLGLSWSDVRVSGSTGSIFFEEGLFGFPDCNLNYYLNGAYPESSEGWGATADHLMLSGGDFYDVAGYTSWSFYSDSYAGFHYFADEAGNVTHTYDVNKDEALVVGLLRTTGGFGYAESAYVPETDYTVYYGQTLYDVAGSVTTDESGKASLGFPEAGEWYVWCDGSLGAENPFDIVSSPAYAKVTVLGEAEAPREPQDVSGVLNATLAQLASTVTAPAFGTNAGEWTVLSLARGGYYAKDSAYFTEYYNRIVETVNTKAASVSLRNGALHASKSTDNSRLILALSAIGKDATMVGDWNLITPYNDFNWIKKQGINGVIFALLALDTNDYATTDATIREQCVDYILTNQHTDGGWSLSLNVDTASDPDVTAMALQALYPYKAQTTVASAADKAFTCLSTIQNANGTYTSWNNENAESCAQVIVAASTWGINPDTDPRFIKNENSVVDALLSHYDESAAAFKHIAAGTTNAMATDQASYALVAYNRFLKNQPALYDMSDVVFDAKDEVVIGKPKAVFSAPEKISDDIGGTFTANISLDQWNHEAGYKLIDFVVNVPSGISVVEVAPTNRLSGGSISYHLEQDTGKLRVVYFDPNNHSDLVVNGTGFPANLFTITFGVNNVTSGSRLALSLSGMSMKISADSTDLDAMTVVDTSLASMLIDVVTGVSYSAVCLYEGDDIDLIPSTKKAVAVSVTGLNSVTKLSYFDGTNNYEFKHNADLSDKCGVATYVAIVDASIEMQQFATKANYTFTNETASEIVFGDTNADGLINAQDALKAVDTWLRKTDAPADDEILAMNVNGDSRINTFDALGIVEVFVNHTEFLIVSKLWN